VHDVVGVTVAAQIAENGEFARLRRGAEIAADWTATLIGDADRRNKRSVVPLPSSQRPLKEKICGCRIGTPVVMRDTSTPAARSSWAKPSRKSLESARLRASVISQRMTGWVASPAVGSNTIRA